jgi:hypothetical protein
MIVKYTLTPTVLLNRSRSKILEWYLQELGVQYTTSDIAMDKKASDNAHFC